MNKTALICDDSNVARKQILRNLPPHWQASAEMTTNGLDAIELLRTMPIDVLFLDIEMPIMDGLNVLQAINEERIDCHVVVISSQKTQEIQQKSLALGAKAFICKPITPAVLVEHLKAFNLL